MKKNSSLFVLAILASSFAFPSPTSAAPSNNDIVNAETITGELTSFTGTLAGSTIEAGETTDEGTPLGSIWYKFSASRYGRVTIGLLFMQKAYYNPGWFLYAYRLSGNTPSVLKLTQISETHHATNLNANNIYVQAGETVYFSIDHYNPYDPAGDFSGTLSFTPIYASNDNVAGAASLTGNTPTASANLSNGSREAGEPILTGNNTLWWKWTAPSAGTTTFSSNGSQYPSDTILSVFSGTSISNLHLLSYQQGGTPISVSTVSGVQYMVALGSASTTTFGTGVLSIEHAPLPATVTPDTGRSMVVAALQQQISKLQQQLKKAKHIDDPRKRAKAIKKIRQKIKRLQRQLE